MAGRRGLMQVWRESLQFRTVVTTVLVTVLVVGAAGIVLMQRISAGILASELRSAQAEAAAGRALARTYAVDEAGSNPNNLIDDLVSELAARGGRPANFDIILLPKSQSDSRPAGATELVSQDSVPPELIQALEQEGGPAWIYGDIRYTDDRTEPGLVLGAPVNIKGVGQYRLYYLFHLEGVEQSLALIRSAIIGVGLVLVVVLGLLAWLLSHRLVMPVRQASLTASALATGDLSRRLGVRGEDDMARLAESFNSMADSLEEQITQLRQLSEMQQRFVADVSHELRTPLTTIRMAAEVLADSGVATQSESQRTVELLQSEVERFEALLADLLEVSRIDSGQAVLEVDDVDLVALATDQIELVSTVAADNGVEIELLGLTECLVPCDSRRIKRIVRNLLVNAVEYGAGHPVQLTITGDGQNAALRVTDSGSGMTAEQADHVFERFWRADPSRARTLGGTGLGLAISREDARLHGGDLTVAAAPNRGSIFTLTLPLNSDRPHPDQQKQQISTVG